MERQRGGILPLADLGVITAKSARQTSDRLGGLIEPGTGSMAGDTKGAHQASNPRASGMRATMAYPQRA